MQINASYKGIWVLAYPIIMGSLAQNCIGVTDIVFLGRVGKIAFDAVGLMSIYYLIMVMIGFGLSRGGQILIARRTGEKNNEAIGSITYNLLYFEWLVALALFLFLFFLSPWVLWLFISNQEIYDASLIYLKYRSFGLFFSFFGFVLMALYTGVGRTNIILFVMGVLFGSNVILNYLLIFGYYGFPEMGIAGAGLASTLAEIISTIAGMIFIFFDKKLKPYNLYKLHPINWQIIQQINKLSMPIVLQYVIGFGGWFFLFSLIESMSMRALGISVALKYVYTFYSIPSWGFASAANAIVSNIIGQKKYRQVNIAINRTCILSFIMTIVASLTLILFPDWILAIFTPDKEVIEGALQYIYLIIVITLAGSISTVIFNGLMGTGATMLSLAIEAFGVVVYLVYAVVVVKVLGYGLGFVWASELIYWVILAVLTWVYMRTNRWKKLSM